MKKQWKWAIGIVLFCILAPIGLFATYIGIRGYAMKSGAATVAAFLGDLRGHDYVAAHLLLSPSKQAIIPVTALQQGQEQIEKKKGHWLFPVEPNEYYPNNTLDNTWYLYTVRVKPDDDMYISVRVVRADDGWRVLEYHYDDDPA